MTNKTIETMEQGKGIDTNEANNTAQQTANSGGACTENGTETKVDKAG